MKRFFSGSNKPGLPPGSINYTGRQTDEPLSITIIDYSPDVIEEKDHVAIEACEERTASQLVSWINVAGLNDTEAVSRIGHVFNLHPLVLEDIVHTSQRPKLEDQGDYIFLVARMLYEVPGSAELMSEQISFILTENCLVTFQERAGDVFDPVRERLRQNHGRIRKMGADYLLYALMDAIVDNYYLIMEQAGEKIEAVERALMENPSSQHLNDLYAQKRELLYIRKSVWPLREAVSSMERGESRLFSKKTGPYLRDLYDHTIQVIDAIETFRDMLSGVQDLCLSSMGNKTNQVMQVLTVISTIFIPLTFVAGIYGMNFDHMPELHWRFAYPLVWFVMILITFGMLAYFRRKKWF